MILKQEAARSVLLLATMRRLAIEPALLATISGREDLFLQLGVDSKNIRHVIELCESRMGSGVLRRSYPDRAPSCMPGRSDAPS